MAAIFLGNSFAWLVILPVARAIVAASTCAAARPPDALAGAGAARRAPA
jgi:hypothetical protein